MFFKIMYCIQLINKQTNIVSFNCVMIYKHESNYPHAFIYPYDFCDQ